MKAKKQKRISAVKMVELSAALMIYLMMFLPFSSAITIDKVNIDASNRYVKVNWITDELSSTIAKVWNNTKTALTKTNPELVKNHTIIVAPLLPNKKYLLNISSVNKNGTVTKGVINFTTLSKDTKPPFIDVQLPAFIKKNEPLSINGLTEPGTEVYVYVNNVLSSSGFQNTSNDGVISLSGIRLNSGSNAKLTTNTMRIAAVDPYGNRNEIIKTIIVDGSPPGITFDKPIPLSWGEKSMIVKGNSDEPAMMAVSIDGNVVKTVNISSPWQVQLDFPTDKKYAAEFYAVDAAGNEFKQNYAIIVDSKPLYLEKNNLNDLTPTHVIYRIVKGKTKPGATVIVTVNGRTTDNAKAFLEEIKNRVTQNPPPGASPKITSWESETITSDPSLTSEIHGIPASFEEIISKINKKKLNYMVTADENGEFSIEMELERTFKLSTEEATSLQSGSMQFDTEDAWKNRIQLMAIDSVGRISGIERNIIYSRCGAGGYFSISSPVPSPNSIPEPVLKAGYAQFSMVMDIKWFGPTPIEDVAFEGPAIITKQSTLAKEDVLGKYNFTIGPKGILKKAIRTYPLVITPQTTQIYGLVSLERTDRDFSIDAKGIDELEFPLMVEFTYSYLKPSTTERMTITQRKCIDVNIMVEPAIEPGKVIRQGLLNLAKGIDNIVRGIDGILPFLSKLRLFGIISCGAMMVYDYSSRALTKSTCLLHGVETGDIRNKPECTTSYDNDGKLTTCDCGGNVNLQICCESTLKAQKVKEQTDYVCSRTFCQGVPSLARHQLAYGDLLVKSASSAKGSADTTGDVLRRWGPVSSQCSIPVFSPAGGKTACEFEFNRAWTPMLLVSWPYESAYDMAYKASVNKFESKGITEGLFRAAEFTSSLCSAEPPNKVKITPAPKEGTVFKISRIAPVEGAEAATIIAGNIPGKNINVAWGKIVAPSEDWVADKNDPNKLTKKTGTETADLVNKEQYFVVTPGFENIYFDPATGYCNDNDDICRKAASGSDIPGGKVKMPGNVMSAVTLFYSPNYVYSPQAGLLSAVKSVCFPATYAYLANYRNTLNHVSSCFKSLAETGTKVASSEACRSLLSSVVCDFVIDAILCSGRTVNNWAKNVPGIVEGGTGAALIPFKGAALAADSMTETFSNTYGDTAGFQALFNQNALMHSVCVGAFTGDWNLEGLADLLSKATTVPIKSTCVAFPANRRFVTSNPLNFGKPTYLYQVGGMLSPGSDIQSLSVKLVCSADNSCTRYGQRSNPNGECDCSKQGKEMIRQVMTDKFSLKQGEIWDDAQYINDPDVEYRYDKLRIEYSYKDNNGKFVPDKCEVEIKEDGLDLVPSQCQWGILGFRCEFSIGDLGTARFVTPPYVSGTGIFYAPTSSNPTPLPISVNIKTEVINPTDSNIAKYARFIIKDPVTKKELDRYDLKLDPGVREYTTYPNKVLTAKDLQLQSPEDSIVIQKYGTTNTDYVTGSKVAEITTDRAMFFITFPTKESYRCNEADDSGGIARITHIGVDTKFASNDPIVGAVIDCSGIKFRITNQANIFSETSGKLPALGKISDYSGTAFFVKYVNSNLRECSSSPIDLIVEVTLLHSQNSAFGNDPSYVEPSNTPVYADNVVQRKEVPIKFVCKPSEEEAKGVTLPVTIKDFSMTKTSIKKGEIVNVNYRVESNLQITQIKLTGLDKEVSLGNSLIGNNIPIKVDAAGDYTKIKLAVSYIIKDSAGKDTTIDYESSTSLSLTVT